MSSESSSPEIPWNLFATYIAVFGLVPYLARPFGGDLAVVIATLVLLAAALIPVLLRLQVLDFHRVPPVAFLYTSIGGLLLGLAIWVWTTKLYGPFIFPKKSLVILGCSVILGPLEEELVFRGILLPALAQKLGKIWSIVVVSVLFALMHPVASFIPTLILSLIAGTLMVRYRNIALPIGVHMLSNFVIEVLDYPTRSHLLWEIKRALSM